MATIKLDHIEPLVGASNYAIWKRGISQVLQGEGYWGHVEGSPNKLAPFPCSHEPSPPTEDSTTEIITTYQDWWQKDSKARTIIERRISPVSLNLLPQGLGVTARTIWKRLNTLYGRVDVMSQFDLRDRLSRARLKDHLDLDRYVGEFQAGRVKFIEMGVPYSEAEMVHQMLRGLPSTASWTNFKQLLTQVVQDHLDRADNSSVDAPDDLLLNRIISRLDIECQRLATEKGLHRSGPGSEYANLASTSSAPIRKHPNNPKGVICTNCNKKSHDVDHCWTKGGGMEGQGPKPRSASSKVPTPPSTVSVPPPEVACVALPSVPPSTFVGDLSCAIFPTAELGLMAQGNLSTLMDSGSSSHLLRSRELFWSYDPSQARNVTTANLGTLSTQAAGDCLARVSYSGTTTVLKLRDCLHAPDACANLISVGRMVRAGLSCNFADNRVVVSRQGTPLAQGPMVGQLFALVIEFLPPPSDAVPRAPSDVACFAQVPVTLDLWHHRLGHIGMQSTRELVKSVTGAQFLAGDSLSRCEPCILGKHSRHPNPPSSRPRSTTLLELIHCDVCGPFPVETPHGKKYFVIFLDDCSSALNLQLLASKDQSFEAWCLLQAKWERKLGVKVQRFRCDGGGELAGGSRRFAAQLEGQGIERDVTPPYEHWKNGRVERVMRTLQGRILSMLAAAQLPLTYWGEAALTAAYLFNLTVTSTLPSGVTPFEMFHGRKPDVSHLRVWGVRCFAHVPVELRGKLGEKSRECLFMGYPPSQRGYRVRDVQTNHFFTSGSVIFDENIPYRARHEVTSDVDYSTLPLNDDASSNDLLIPVTPPRAGSSTQVVPDRPPKAAMMRSPRPQRLRILTEAGRAYAQKMLEAKEHLSQLREAAARRAELARVPDAKSAPEGMSDVDPALAERDEPITEESSNPSEAVCISLDPATYLDQDNQCVCESALLSIRSDVPRSPLAVGYDMSVPPATHREAAGRSDAADWLRVEQKELGMLRDMGVYQEELLPDGRKAIGCRWVFEFKLVEGGSPIHKARLVAQGFSQVALIDYDATFAPVVKSVSIRLLAVHAALNGWHLETFDATRAFLWGDLSRVIYMRCPPGYTPSFPGAVWRLLKSLYGLKQASRVWYKLLRSVLEKLGFVRSNFDHALFIFNRLWSGTLVHCLLAMHVDDGLAGCNHPPFLTHIKAEIRKAFGIKDLGPVTSFLGVQFERNLSTRELWLHQSMYIDTLLADYGMTDCNSVATPLDPHHPLGLESDTSDAVPNLLESYQRLVGSLLFLQMCTRPDLSFAILLLSQHCSSPLPRHFAAARRVLRYLKGTKDLRLRYGGSSAHLSLSGLSDADWAGDKSSRASTSAFVWSLAGGPVSWSSKKQSCIALSTAEAEYVALTRAIQEGLWIHNSLLAMHLPCPSSLSISTDNLAAKSLAENDSSHGRAKHIDIRYHFIRSHIESGRFAVSHVPGPLNSADLLTKPLSRPVFLSHVARIGLVSR